MLNIIKNSKGEQVLLNSQEDLVAKYWETQIKNSLGYDIDITTLTTIVKKVTDQKFYKTAFADYVPVTVGNGTWGDQLTTYTSFVPGGSFEQGLINVGDQNDRLASTTAGIDSVTVKIKNWAKAIYYSIFQIQQASKSGNWDLIQALEVSRKTNWDLGLQDTAFIGLASDPSVLGLFTQSGVTANLSLIPQSISSLSVVDLKAFCAGVLEAYRTNCSRTAWPTHFVVPESDYLGMGAPASAEFPIQSVLEQLQKAFAIMTGNSGFKILPSAYGDIAFSGQSYQQYALYNYDDTSLRMDIPLDYTGTLQNTLNGFNYQNVGYGQFTGVKAYRPAEMLYFRYTP